MSINLKEHPSVLKIIFLRGTYDMTTGEVIKNKLKVAIPLEFLYKIPPSNYKISYTLVSLIMHDGYYLYCGHYVSDIFDTRTRIWWHCDDENITQFSDLPEGVILERITKKEKVMSVSKDVLFVVYIITSYIIKSSSFFPIILQHAQKPSYEESNQ